MEDVSQLSQRPASFDKALLLICSTCSKQFDPNMPNPTDRLKSELKVLAKKEFNKSVRIVSSSCLGVCPKEQIAICFIGSQKNTLFSISEINPDTDSTDLFGKLFSHLE